MQPVPDLRRNGLTVHLENKLHRELEKSGIQRCYDLAELAGIQRCRGIAGTEAICKVVRLGTEFQSLVLTDLEGSGQRQIESPERGPFNAPRAQGSNRAEVRLYECSRIQEIRQGAVSIRTGQYLIRTLGGDAIQCAVQTAGDVEISAGGIPVDSRQPPPRADHAHCGIRK